MFATSGEKLMRLRRHTLEETFANKFKRYSFLLCLILLSLFLLTNEIANDLQFIRFIPWHKGCISFNLTLRRHGG
jgi:hypothetical protein